MENLLGLHGQQIRDLGEIRNSFGDFEPSWIASADVGAIAAALLADPGLVTDRTTNVGGAERLSHTTIAEIIGKLTGRPVRYQTLTPEEWRDEMIALHSEVNGKEYWRDLLWLTMKEIPSEPNYAPFELRRVDKPVLVIMGAEDKVNAPDEHAQYIARHIPDAELWIPEGTGHNVHLERREEWTAKVLDFLKRRGS